MTCSRMRPLSLVVVVTLAVASLPQSSYADDLLADIESSIASGNFEHALALIERHEARQIPSVRFTKARVLGYLDQNDAALRELDALRVEFPEDVDYVLARARILDRLGDDRAALDELRIATGLAPGYEEPWRLRYTVLARQPDSAELEDVRREAAARFPDAGWLPAEIPEEAYEWAVMVGAAYDSLDNGFPSWNNQFFEISAERLNHSRYGLRIGRDDRASATDYSLAAAAERTWSSRWFAGADLGWANDPEYLPKLGLSVHAGRALAHGWVLDLRLRQRDYATTWLRSAITTVERYIGDFRIAYGISASRLEESSTFYGHALTANWYYNDQASVGISLNGGKEVESLGGGLVLETDVEGLAFMGHHALNERTVLRWWLGVHDQGELYRRRFIGMAVSLRI